MFWPLMYSLYLKKKGNELLKFDLIGQNTRLFIFKFYLLQFYIADIDECTEFPDVCSSIVNSHCVDEVPALDQPDRWFTCECNDGYTEIVTGICNKGKMFYLHTYI